MSQAINLKLFPLPQLGLLQLAGPDGRKFLQGQITNDSLQIGNQLLHAAHCTAKGRIIANFDCFADQQDNLYLRLPNSSIEPLQQSLGKYIVFSKAELSPWSGTGFSLMGEDAALYCRNTFALSEQHQVHELDGDFLLLIDDQRVEVWTAQPETSPILGQLKTSFDIQPDHNDWDMAEINAGRAWITSANSDQLLPQMINLDNAAINGVSFTKGCYTGQEIIARMHYKGQAKRHLQLFGYPSESQPVATAAIFNDQAKTVGEVVNATTAGGESKLLAVVNDADLEFDLFLDEQRLQKLTPLELPYAINDEK